MENTTTESEQYRNDVEQWIEKIRSWDCEDVYDLLNLIRDSPKVPDVQDCWELQAWGEDQWERISDDLPIAEEFEERVSKVAAYPVWTCDKKGYCLVGEVPDSVTTLEYIEETKWARGL
jgi:hypothetical protein